MKTKSVVESYNRLIYESGPIKVSDFISSVPDKVHNEMYKEALKKFFIDYPQFDNKNIKIIEVKDKEYWMPSKIKLIDYTKKPLQRYEFSLEKYWDNIYCKKEKDGSIPEVLGSDNDRLNYLDYVQGKATMLDKYNNETYKVDFKYLGNEIELSDEFNVYPETFAYKKIYGNGF